MNNKYKTTLFQLLLYYMHHLCHSNVNNTYNEVIIGKVCVYSLFTVVPLNKFYLLMNQSFINNLQKKKFLKTSLMALVPDFLPQKIK